MSRFSQLKQQSTSFTAGDPLNLGSKIKGFFHIGPLNILYFELLPQNIEIAKGFLNSPVILKLVPDIIGIVILISHFVISPSNQE